jgi:endonuclease VIII
MPEGDTLYRIAATLRPALEATEVTLSMPRLPFRETELQLRTVRSFGKHLLIEFADGRVLHTHLKMTGIWHLYPHQDGNRWQRPARDAVAVIENSVSVAVCFRAPVAQLLAPLSAKRLIATLGKAQDVLDPSFDVTAVVTTLQAQPHAAIGVALLDQSIIAGIGNVYKSEGLFAASIHPATQISQISSESLRFLVSTIAQMMRRNVADIDRRSSNPTQALTTRQPQYQYQRTTRSGCEVGKGPIAVYGRLDRSCFRCGADIQMFRQGDQQRSSYFCPTCQPLG